MLSGLRNFFASFVGKVVFVLILLAFASGFWYFGGPTGGGDPAWAVRVGDQTIAAETVRADYERELARLRAEAGIQVDSAQARAMGLPGLVIERLVNQTLLDLAAADLNLAASDDLVRDAIRRNPAFQGPDGTFDRNVYGQTLRFAGFSERQFEDMVRREVARNQLLVSMGGAVTVPDTILKPLFRHHHERRTATVVRIGDRDLADAVEPPSEQELAAYHDANAERFMAPEYRSVTAIVLGVDHLAPQMAVSDAEIRAEYQDRVDEFFQPEQRTLQQIVVPDRDAAERALERIRGGADFLTVAEEEAGLSADAVDLGTVTRRSLLPALADAAFSVDEGEVADPVQSPIGWHLFKVTEVMPASTVPLADVRDEIAAELAAEKARDALFDLSNRLQDTLGAGVSLEEAADRLDLPLIRVDAVDATGRDPDGDPVEALPEAAVEEAFMLGAGEESLLGEYGIEGYFVVRVDDVMPPAVRPLESVRAEVRDAVMADRLAEAAAERAEGIADAVRAGRDLAEVAGDHGLESATTPPFNRGGEGAPDLPRGLIEAVFEADRGQAVVVRAREASFIAEVQDTHPADPDRDRQEAQAFRDNLRVSLGNDLVAQYLDAMRQRHPVAVNPEVTDRLF
ncbi:MAG: hypothetical protein EA405_13410 [Rhodospirillales bacterium]|nr:MAG: hypothetical protein EA405_13410 [Rhodospirillales bacterium]